MSPNDPGTQPPPSPSSWDAMGGLIKKIGVPLMGAVVPILIIVILVRQFTNTAIVVKTVTVPTTLAPLSASELTHRLADAIDSVKYEARPSPGQKRYTMNSDVTVPDVEVPMTATKLATLVALLKNVLRRDAWELTWEVSGHPNGRADVQWVVTASLEGHALHQARFDPLDPGPALSAIAQGVIGDVEPLILARALLYDGKCEDALAVAQRLLRREATAGRDQSDALNFIGFASECSDPSWGVNTMEAVRYYRDAIAHDSANGLPRANLGRMFAMRAHAARDSSIRRAFRDSMMSEFALADRLKPRHPGIQESWGWALLVLGDPKGALVHLDEAIREEPRLAAAYFSRADAYHQLGDFARAAAEYARGIVRSPADIQHVKAYGHELIFVRDWRGASGAFARAARLDTTDYDTRYYLGCSLRRVDSTAAAVVLEGVIGAMGPKSPYTTYARSIIASDTVSCQ